MKFKKQQGIACAESLEPRRLLAGFAPVSLVGMRIETQDSALGDAGLALSDGFGYQMVLGRGGRYTVGTLSGSYTYQKTGPNQAILQFTVTPDPGGSNAPSLIVPLTLSFSDKLTGSYYGIDSDSTGHPGEFIIVDRSAPTAPASIAGLRFLCSTGEQVGSFDFRPKADGSYVVSPLPGALISGTVGTYTYTKEDRRDGSLSLNDPTLGNNTSASFFMVSGDAGWLDIEPTQYGEITQITGVFSIQGKSGGPLVGGQGGQPQISATVASPLPQPTAKKTKQSATVLLTNTGSGVATGPVAAALFLSADGQIDQYSIPVATVRQSVRIRPGGSKFIKARFTYPALFDGTYRLMARVTGAASASTTSMSANALTIGAPLAHLTGTVVTPVPTTAGLRSDGTVSVQITNPNHVPIAGPYVVALALASVGQDGTPNLNAQTPIYHTILDGPLGPGNTQVTLDFQYNAPQQGLYELVVSGEPPGNGNNWDWIDVVPTVVTIG